MPWNRVEIATGTAFHVYSRRTSRRQGAATYASFMNLLILQPHELDDRAQCVLEGRRAQHLLTVLGVARGDSLRAAVADQSLGTALVTAVQDGKVAVAYRAESTVAPPRRVLCLAVPRPKVLSRCVQHATALGFGRIALFRSYRVDKAHLGSQRLMAERLLEDVRLGMEQGRRIHTPRVELFDRFKPFVEDHLETLSAGLSGYVGHPTSPLALPRAERREGPYALVVGPEGGLIDYEIEALQARGFLPIRAGAAPLRVESALSYLTGQLDFLHHQEAGA